MFEVQTSSFGTFANRMEMQKLFFQIVNRKNSQSIPFAFHNPSCPRKYQPYAFKNKSPALTPMK